MIRRASFMLFAFAVATGCTDPERAERAGEEETSSSDTEMAAVEIDEADVLASAMGYENNLQQFNSEPEPQQTHSDAASVIVWGTPEIAEVFASIDPNDPTQEVSFEPGTLLVKEHFDLNGVTIGLTVMYKGPPGYNESGGDWFWARVRGSEITHQGRVDFCLDCHRAAENTDFVVGFAKSE